MYIKNKKEKIIWRKSTRVCVCVCVCYMKSYLPVSVGAWNLFDVFC